MFYRKMRQQLNMTWGNPAGVWQHGARIGFRKRAGEKGGHPLTLEEVAIRKLDRELVAAEKAAARASDPRNDFEKKYNIYEGAAHIDSQKLLDLIAFRTGIIPLRRRVKVIHISDGVDGVEATFIFGDKDVFTEEYGPLETITAAKLRKHGIIACLEGAKSKYIYGGKAEESLRGLLIVGNIPPSLAHTHKAAPHIAKQEEESSEGLTFPVDLVKAFRDPALLKECLLNEVIEVTVTPRRSWQNGQFESLSPLVIGELQSLERATKNGSDRELKRINSLDLRGEIKTLSSIKLGSAEKITEDCRTGIAALFNRHAGYIIYHKMAPIAVLLPNERSGTLAYG